MKATLCHDQPLPGVHQISDQFTGLGFVHNGTDRYLHHQVLSRLAGTVPAPAIFAALCNEFPGMAKINQRIHATVGFQADTAAIAAITAVRPAELDVFFTPETDTTIPPVTGTDFNGGFIDKFHGLAVSTA